jgi:hypothetical protein
VGPRKGETWKLQRPPRHRQDTTNPRTNLDFGSTNVIPCQRTGSIWLDKSLGQMAYT